MLVRLTSRTSGEIIMFAEDARRLFEIIGKERTARGVFTREQLPAAIASLQEAVAADNEALRQVGRKVRADDGQDEHAPDDDAQKTGRAVVQLGQRAHPLLRMMERTLQQEGFVLWEAEQPF
jgi:hypothetical protein